MYMYKYLYSFVLAGSINSYLKVLVPLGTAVCTNKYAKNVYSRILMYMYMPAGGAVQILLCTPN